MDWYNTSTSSWECWNGTAWVTTTVPGSRYLCLLTADPVANGVVNISDTGFVEMSDTNYARQNISNGQAAGFTAVTGSPPTYPPVSSNAAAITFGGAGGFAATMTTAVGWIAMVTVSSGTAGYFLCSWALPTPILADISQTIQIGAGTLIIQDQ